MAQPYVGEIRMFAGNFEPQGWMFCSGQTLQIAEWDVLFQLIGTTYGGDGQSTFNLPDLRGRVPIHMGQGPQVSQNYQLAEMGGLESVTLTTQQMPFHTHPMLASTAIGDKIDPAGRVLATSFNVSPYINDLATGNMNAGALSAAGGSQPHSNLQPFVCVNFIISMYGLFPSP